MNRLNSLVNLYRSAWLRHTAGAVVCAVALPALAGAATPVKNFTMVKSGDFTEVTLPVPSHQLCDHFTEPATAERPFRIVLNLCNAEHAMPQQNFSSLPASMVQKIRTSQFATTPELIVRVVLDLKSSATYTVRTESDRVVIAIADPSPAFAKWEACPQPMMAKAEPVSKPQVTATVEKAQMATKQEIVMKPTESKPASPQMAQASKQESAVKKADKPQIAPPAPAASQPATAKPSQSMVLEVVPPTAPQMQTPNSTNPSLTMTMDELAGPTSTTKSPVVPLEDFKLPAQPLVFAPEDLDAISAGPVPTPAVDAGSTQPMSQTQPATMPGYDGNTPNVNTNSNDAPMLAVTNPPPALLALPPTVSSSDTVSTQEALIDRLKEKFFSGARAPKPYLTEQGIIAEQLNAGDSSALGPPSPGFDMDREALLERIRQAALQSKGPGNALPSVPGGPARSEVFYYDLGRRDPFEPLLKGLRSGFLSDALPSVETLRMVGVLKDDDQSLALMEDTEGHSYILRPGDPVDNGRVISVGEARTVLQVDEYGWTRTVVLQLSPRGGDPSKAMGARTYSGEKQNVEEAGEAGVAAPPMPE